MTEKSRHKFAHDQICTVENELYEGTVQVLALLPETCAEHDLPRYGCAAGDKHFAFCEAALTQLTTTQKRRMN